MLPLDITFDVATEPQTFAHIKSADGILGHAAEVRKRIPVGTWLAVQPEYQPTVTEYLIRKCCFRYAGALIRGNDVDDILQKVSE